MTRSVSSQGSERDWNDWAALSELLAKVEATHQCVIQLTIKLDGSGYKSFVAVVAKASMPVLIGPGRTLSLELSSHYPLPKHSTFVSLLLEMVRRMNQRIGEEIYRQRELPLTPPQE